MCRRIAREQGTYIRRRNKSEFEIGSCGLWPEGIVTDYHGWLDLLLRLRHCVHYPESVVNGRYVRSKESEIAA
jgi:hypothetical protein